MKTPKQWMDAFDPAWGDELGQPTVLTKERVREIQDDALKFDLEVNVSMRAENDALRAQLTAAQAEIARLTSTLITHHPMRNLPKEVTELQDWLDMALDEFQRIHSCPGADSEIQQLCERAQTHIRQHVHVITQRDDALSQLHAAQTALREAEAARGEAVDLLKLAYGDQQSSNSLGLWMDMRDWLAARAQEEKS